VTAFFGPVHFCARFSSLFFLEWLAILASCGGMIMAGFAPLDLKQEATRMNRQIVLAARPHGEPKESDFRLVETPVPEPGPGQMLLHTLYLSLDPYMRGRMSAGPSYAAATEIGDVMPGATVCRVEASHIPNFSVGDIVQAYAGWQEYTLSDGRGVRKLNPSLAPISTALGVLGMPGLTAWTGLMNIGQPKAGETLVVGAASGAVGSVVGQLAKIKGCRAVGIAGGERKCRYVVDELGFDACIDHRQPNFAEMLKEACPKGIDINFENVGGPVFDAVLPLLNAFARVPVCGLVAHYNATELPTGVDRIPLLLRHVLTKRLTLRGFIVFDFASQQPDFLAEVGPLVRDGRITYREDVVDGLENAPRGLIGLLRGENFGKMLVRVVKEDQAG
jgi:NADPH-dependent curcumin reductase